MTKQALKGIEDRDSVSAKLNLHTEDTGYGQACRDRRALLAEVRKWRELAEKAEDLLRDAEGIDNDVADQWFVDMWAAKEGTK